MHEHFEFVPDAAPPEAKAFVRSILSHPEDRLRRLVFSDWLEERGGDSNTAWAGYLRAHAALETASTPQERTDLQQHCDQQVHYLRATLELPLAIVAANFETLTRLLPSGNIRVQFGNGSVGAGLIEMVPESVTRENEVFLFAMSARKLAIAAVTPSDDLRDKLAFILNREVTLFSGDADDLLQAIDREYGPSEYESIDCVFPQYDPHVNEITSINPESYDPPIIGIESDELYDLFQLCIDSGFSGFTARRNLFRAWLEYFGPRKSEAISISRTVFKKLLDYLLSLRRDTVAAHNQVIERHVRLPLRSGRECPVYFERDVRGRWFRVTFQYE